MHIHIRQRSFTLHRFLNRPSNKAPLPLFESAGGVVIPNTESNHRISACEICLNVFIQGAAVTTRIMNGFPKSRPTSARREVPTKSSNNWLGMGCILPHGIWTSARVNQVYVCVEFGSDFSKNVATQTHEPPRNVGISLVDGEVGIGICRYARNFSFLSQKSGSRNTETRVIQSSLHTSSGFP